MANQNWKVQKAIELLKTMKPEERAKLDKALIGELSKEAEARRRQYGLVLASEYVDEAKQLVANWGKMQGMTSHYPSIDALTKGFVDSELVVIGGATSNGKTTLAVNFTARMSAHGIPILFVTLEMSRAQLTSRLIHAYPRFEECAVLMSYQSCDEMDWRSIDGLIETAVQQMGVRMVVIDHLHYFTRELNNVAEDLGRITKEFKKNATRHNIPIVVISHTRKGEGTDINDLRGSSYIAQDADVVLMVSRPEEYPNALAVTVQKNRNRGFDKDNNEAILAFQQARLLELEEAKTPWNT